MPGDTFFHYFYLAFFIGGTVWNLTIGAIYGWRQVGDHTMWRDWQIHLLCSGIVSILSADFVLTFLGLDPSSKWTVVVAILTAVLWLAIAFGLGYLFARFSPKRRRLI